MDSIPQKQCTKCNQFFPATSEFFSARNDVPSGLRSHCRECIRVADRARRPKDDIPPGYKRCSQCKECKLATTEFFEPSKECTYGVVATCRECHKQRGLESITIPQKMKQCSKCNELKPTTLEFFHRRTTRSSGLSSWCRTCTQARKLEHIEERKQYNLLYSRSHVEQSKQYYRSHREELRQYKQRRYESRKEEFKQGSRNYTKLHKEAISISKRRYHQEHRDEVQARHRNLIAKRKQAVGKHTAKDIEKQYANQKGRCYYCHKKVAKGIGSFHVDHVIPLSRGGSNDPSNLVIACPTCNTRKYNRLPHEWPEGGRLM